MHTRVPLSVHACICDVTRERCCKINNHFLRIISKIILHYIWLCVHMWFIIIIIHHQMWLYLKEHYWHARGRLHVNRIENHVGIDSQRIVLCHTS